MTTQTMHEAPAKVRHPLEAVRSHIRRYVFLEAAAMVLLFLALWFWIGLILDYGLFLLTSYDWMLELNFVDPSGVGSIWVRMIVFLAAGGFLLYLIGGKLFARVFKEFSDPAVAMVLERRFPKELGDRLITAVELSDPKKAAEYGFSGEMLQQTVNEAAERVDKLPVKDVFDWARLRKQWGKVILATVGMFVLTGFAAYGIQSARGRATTPAGFLYQFRDTASIWVERNILFQNAYWLRNSHLEIVRFQDTESHPGEMRVGRDEQRPDLVVRAVEWVVPDAKASAGWRALRVAEVAPLVGGDLFAKVAIPESWPHWIVDLDDAPARIPAGMLPTGWQGRPYSEVAVELAKDANLRDNLKKAESLDAVQSLGNWKEWTFDKLLLQMSRSDIEKQLAGNVAAIQAIAAKLEEVAADPSMSRRLRKLALPRDVSVTFRGPTTTSTAPATTQPDNKFAFSLGDLKESVTFFARGDDYFTAPLKITLVPPPAVKSLGIDTEEPAYLYYRVPGEQAALKGKRQRFANLAMSVTGDMTTIDIPIGSHMTLKAQVDRPLKDGIHIRAATQLREAGTVVPDNPVVRDSDRLGFSVRFDNVVKTMEFQFEFLDEDNVRGRRRIRIRPVDDQPPEILNFELAAVLRKPRFKAEVSKSLAGGASEGLLVTPDAMLPFNGNVRDDVGLTALNWGFEVQPVLIEKGTDQGPARVVLQGNPTTRRAGLIGSAMQFTPAQPLQALLAPSYLGLISRVLEADLKQKQPDPERLAGLADFRDRLLRLEDLPLNQIEEKLKEKLSARPTRKPHLRDHSLKENEFFNVREHLPDLKMTGPKDGTQQFHLLKLGVVAVDNNVDTGPSVTRTRSPILFLIVTEPELLGQIAQEEEILRDRLEKTVAKLKAAQTTLAAQMPMLRSPSPDIDYSLVVLRVDEVRKGLLDGGTASREIFGDYSRILKEMQINRVKSQKVHDVRVQIVQPLELIIHPERGNFALSDDIVQRLYTGLEDDVAGKTVQKNIARRLEDATLLDGQLVTLIEQLSTILQSIDRGIDFNELLQTAIRIQESQRQVIDPLRVYHDDELRRLLDELLNDTKKK